MKLGAILGAALIAAAVAPTAQAAGPFQGPYVGASLGYGWGEIASHSETDSGPVDIFNSSGNPSGWNVGVILGHDIQVNRAVLGIFGDVIGLDGFAISTTEPCPVTPGCTRDFSGRLENLATLGGRFGIAVGMNSMLYGVAGYSWGTANLREFEGCGAVPCDDLAYNGSVTLHGPTFGVGIEHVFGNVMMGSRWSGRLEYRFAHLEGNSISGECTTTSVPACGADYFGTTSAEADVHTVRFGLTFRWDRLQ
jgi:outer membrane immunogenic protein